MGYINFFVVVAIDESLPAKIFMPPLVLGKLLFTALSFHYLMCLPDRNFNIALVESSWQTCTRGEVLGFISFVLSFTYFGFISTYRIQTLHGKPLNVLF